MKSPIVLKENRKPQRVDVALTKDIANALVQKILAGENLFTSAGARGTLELQLEGGETISLYRSTIQSWVSRGNVVPETGYTLRAILDKAREEKRVSEREARQKVMIEEAEKTMHRTVRLNTNLPVVGMFGVVKDEKGNIVRKENAALLKVKMDTTQFILERLDAEKYGKKDKVKQSTWCSRCPICGRHGRE